jgi:hypothetical protein
MASEQTKMKPREIIVNDRMQKGYRYFLTKSAGQDFDPIFFRTI